LVDLLLEPVILLSVGTTVARLVPRRAVARFATEATLPLTAVMLLRVVCQRECDATRRSATEGIVMG
jgi:hypothetical protein